MNVLEKVTAEELAAANPKVVGRLTNELPEVEGQDPYLAGVECPWCGMRGRAILDTEKGPTPYDFFEYYACGHCGHSSRRRGA